MTAIRSLFIAWLALSAAPAFAQPQTTDRWSPELSVSAGLGHVFRFDDRTLGDRANAGGSIAVVHRSGFAVEFEADRTFGLEPIPTPCGIVGVTCVGTGHDGPLSATVTSLNIQYRFKKTRVQPYLTAGLGMLWSRSVHSLTQVSGRLAIVTDSESTDRGFGPDLGAGVRIAVARGIAISPEIRWLDAPWLSRENLAVTRLVVRTSYRW